MINGNRVLAYIPARSGSKGIKNKNIVDVCGKPLIAYSIEQALGSNYVDKVIVSTDSEDYAKIARQFGAEVPFIRPKELATDNAKEIDVVLHLMNWLEENISEKFEIICKLEATTPLRVVADVNNAIKMLIDKNAESIITVNEVTETPLWMNTLPPDLSMKNFLKPEIMTKNRQELSQYYFVDGLFVAKWEHLKKKRSWYSEKSFAYIIPRDRAVDIDELLDLEFVRFLMEKRNNLNRK